jgi:hypothetical protein
MESYPVTLGTWKCQEHSPNMACEYYPSSFFCFQVSDNFNQLRIVNAFRFCLRTQRPKVAPTSDQLFQPLITTSHAPIMEIDFNLHSQYFQYEPLSI